MRSKRQRTVYIVLTRRMFKVYRAPLVESLVFRIVEYKGSEFSLTGVSEWRGTEISR